MKYCNQLRITNLSPIITHFTPYHAPYILDKNPVAVAVSETTGIPIQEMKEPNRKRELVTCRQITFFCMKNHPKYKQRSLAWIGSAFGKDHATVLHAIRAVNNHCETEPDFLKMVMSVCEKLGIKPSFNFKMDAVKVK